VPRAKILHTAQSLFHDHVPAKKHFAMTTIWINRQAGKPGATPADLDVTPDWEVPSMAAMVELHKEHLAG
jgi:FMN phosphatase YigB (HAD superfamily)